MTIAFNSYPGDQDDLVVRPHAGVFVPGAFGSAEAQAAQGQFFQEHGRPRSAAEMAQVAAAASSVVPRAGVAYPELSLDPYYDQDRAWEGGEFQDIGMRQTPEAIEASIRSGAR